MESSARLEDCAEIIFLTVFNNKKFSGNVTIVSKRFLSLKTKGNNNLLPKKFANEISCIACINGNFPTGLHCCVYCKKAVRLFDCSVPALNTAEGCGKKTSLFECTKKKKY